jgi:phage shock protein C
MSERESFRRRGTPFDDRPFRKLYRIPSKGMLFGVCAGIAEYFGFNLTLTRIIAVVGAVFSFPLVVTVYFLLALLLKKEPSGPDFPRADDVERRVRAEPHATLSSLRYRFRDMDARLQRLEKYVTSKRYRLDREFEQLRD